MSDDLAINPRGPGPQRSRVPLPPKAILYARCSTAEQSASGLGLEAQEAAGLAAAARLGLPVAARFVDAGIGGSVPLEGRPGLMAAIDALAKGDTLIIAKRDRLGRDVLLVCLIQKLIERKGARVASAAGEGTDDDGPTSILMRQIIDAFGQYERAIIRQRTTAALGALIRRGYRAGTVPLGYRAAPDGKLFPCEREQATLKALRLLRGQGKMMQATVDELNAQGHRSRTGTLLRWQYVQRAEAA